MQHIRKKPGKTLPKYPSNPASGELRLEVDRGEKGYTGRKIPPSLKDLAPLTDAISAVWVLKNCKFANRLQSSSTSL